MGIIEEQLGKRLKHTFKLYVTHAIEHALSAQKTEHDILQSITNFQAALELLTKFYLMRNGDWKTVVETSFHRSSEADILKAIQNGNIKTTQFSDNKKLLKDLILLDKTDLSLMNKFQTLRNQVVHLGVINPPQNILNEAILFFGSIIHKLEWQDTLPTDDQFMTNSLSCLIGPALYQKLITNSSYVGDAIDRAHDHWDDVKYCIECGNESWVLADNDDVRICYVCGLRGPEDAFGFIDCPNCKAEGALIYDALNIADNESIPGKCCACTETIDVTQCPECEKVFPAFETCPVCSKYAKNTP